MADQKLRTVEAWDPLKGEWFDVQFGELRKGHVFRMFDDQEKQNPVIDKEPPGEIDEPVSTWVCVDNAYPQDPPANFGVQTVPVPGF